MMKQTGISLLVLGVVLFGCGQRADVAAVQKKVNQTNALAKLREYQVAQNVYSMETDGIFAVRLVDLYQMPNGPPDKPGLISRALAAASSAAANPVPLSGYLFADVTESEDGSPVRPERRFGLSAFPLRPGVTGDVILLILQDENAMAPPDEERPMTRGEHTIWAKRYTAADRPVTRWPSRSELERDFVRLDRSVEEAKALIDSMIPAR